MVWIDSEHGRNFLSMRRMVSRKSPARWQLQSVQNHGWTSLRGCLQVGRFDEEIHPSFNLLQPCSTTITRDWRTIEWEETMQPQTAPFTRQRHVPCPSDCLLELVGCPSLPPKPRHTYMWESPSELWLIYGSAIRCLITHSPNATKFFIVPAHVKSLTICR